MQKDKKKDGREKNEQQRATDGSQTAQSDNRREN